ncbi:MAG: hypothetical protein K5744_04460 [Eubacterium sp.]|nr:hypothetical protein [Eubacterium sp.]
MPDRLSKRDMRKKRRQVLTYLYNQVGYNEAYTYHMISTGNVNMDQTHFTEKGAKAIAKLVADDLKRQ